MQIRSFTLFVALMVLTFGVIGFFPLFAPPPLTNETDFSLVGSYGYLFGLFATNSILNVVRIGIGLLGLCSLSSLPAARNFTLGIVVLFGLFAGMGLIPSLRTAFGYMPLFGHNVWLHMCSAALIAYVSFAGLAATELVRRPNQPSEKVKVYEERPRR